MYVDTELIVWHMFNNYKRKMQTFENTKENFGN